MNYSVSTTADVGQLIRYLIAHHSTNDDDIISRFPPIALSRAKLAIDERGRRAEFVGGSRRASSSSAVNADELSRINAPRVIELRYQASFRATRSEQVKGLSTRVWEPELFAALESLNMPHRLLPAAGRYCVRSRDFSWNRSNVLPPLPTPLFQHLEPDAGEQRVRDRQDFPFFPNDEISSPEENVAARTSRMRTGISGSSEAYSRGAYERGNGLAVWLKALRRRFNANEKNENETRINLHLQIRAWFGEEARSANSIPIIRFIARCIAEISDI